MVSSTLEREGSLSPTTAARRPFPDGYATLVVRNKHTVVADVTYTPEKYSVVYKSSINMKYDIQNGVPVIHPFYNDWAKKLVDAIRVECAKS